MKIIKCKKCKQDMIPIESAWRPYQKHTCKMCNIDTHVPVDRLTTELPGVNPAHKQDTSMPPKQRRLMIGFRFGKLPGSCMR
jgi:hypothetical protein